MKMMDDMLDLSLEPDGHLTKVHQRLPPLRNSLLRTAGRLKIVSVKKYLAQRLDDEFEAFGASFDHCLNKRLATIERISNMSI